MLSHEKLKSSRIRTPTPVLLSLSYYSQVYHSSDRKEDNNAKAHCHRDYIMTEKGERKPGLMAEICNLNSWEAEVKAYLGYKGRCSRPTWAT